LPAPLRAPTPEALLRIFAGSLTMTAVLVGVALHSLRGALADARRYALRSEELLLEVPGVVAMFDRRGVVLAVSASATELTGYAPGEIVGKHVSRLDLFWHDRLLASEELRKLAVQGDGAAAPLRLTRKDGGTLWAEARMHWLARDQGEALRRVVLYDVTRRRFAEERQAELEKRVEQGRRFETMGLLVGGVTHDFGQVAADDARSTGRDQPTLVPRQRQSKWESSPIVGPGFWVTFSRRS